MGRHSTGAWSVYESLRIEISYLIQRGYVVKGGITSSTLIWTDQHGNNSGSIGIICSYLQSAEYKYIQLNYTVTDKVGQKNYINDRVFLIEIPSNLDVGKFLYFLCPQTGRKCRILYRAYGSPIFKCRQAYSHRLYYDCQQSSKLSRYNNNYWRIDKHINNVKKQTCEAKRRYNGKLTKRACRQQRLLNKQNLMDELRWTEGVPKRIRHLVF